VKSGGDDGLGMGLRWGRQEMPIELWWQNILKKSAWKTQKEMGE
jgi:hypothetical protein